MASEPVTQRPGDGWGWIMAYGIVSVIVGLLAFAWPFAATFTAVVIIGAFFAAAGVMGLIAGLMGRGHEGRLYTILFSLVSLIIGLIMIFDTATGALSVTLFVIVWLAVRGIMEIVLGTRFKRHRTLMIVLGVVNVLLAIYVFATLGISAMVLPGFILGISFVFSGVTSILSAAAHRQGARAFSA
jgi:uncharacterized membrane protein HdeD (DUF308 family)